MVSFSGMTGLPALSLTRSAVNVMKVLVLRVARSSKYLIRFWSLFRSEIAITVCSVLYRSGRVRPDRTTLSSEVTDTTVISSTWSDVTFTDSLNVSVSVPTFRSKSKLINSGRVESGTTSLACKARLGTTGVTTFPFMSWM